MTDGAFSPDGRHLVLRSYFSARGYEFENGRLGADHAVVVPFQRQSESVTYTADGSAMMFGSEGKNSRVVRVEAKAEDGYDGKDGTKEGGGSGGTAPSGTASGTGSGEDGDGDGAEKGTVTGGAVLLAVIALAVFGFRKRRG